MKSLRMVAFILAVPALAHADTAADLARAEELAKSVKHEDLEQAVMLYEALLKQKPDDFELLLRTATAMNDLMSVLTNQNLPYIKDGDMELADTSTNKKVWRKWSETASGYAKKALEQRPKDIRAAMAYASSYAYLSSSMGIVSAILDGASGTYKENASRLIDLDPRFDDGIGYFFFGAFYLVAPWPIGDADEARTYLEKTLKVSPSSVRNHYLMGVLEFEEENWDASARAFQWVLDHPCRSVAERQVCGFLKKRSKIALAEIAEEQD